MAACVYICIIISYSKSMCIDGSYVYVCHIQNLVTDGGEDHCKSSE